MNTSVLRQLCKTVSINRHALRKKGIMAVNIPGSKPPANEVAAQAPVQAPPPQVQAAAPAQAFQPQTTQQSQGNKMNNANTNTVNTHVPAATGVYGRRRHGLQTTNASGLAGEMIKIFDESMKTPPQDGNKYEMLLVNAGESGLKISALVFVALPADTKAPKKLAHHTLLLAATATMETVVVSHTLEFARNRKVNRTLLPCDGNDDQMKAVVKQALARRYPGFEQLSAEASEVPRTILASDVATLQNLMANATRAAGTVLYHEGDPNAEDVTLQDLVDPETQERTVLAVEINSSFAHQANKVKFPTRADLILTVSESRGYQGQNQQNDQQSGFNSLDASNRISRISGFFDLSWTGPQAFNPVGGMQQSNIHYSPQFIVTDVDTDVTETLPTLFLALGSLQTLCDNGRWKQYLLKQHKEGAAHPVAENKNLRDLGLIGYEVPPMGMNGMDAMQQFINGNMAVKAPFPTATLNHDDAFLNMIINNYIGNTVLPVSFDIPESGPSTWVTSVLLHAAIGGHNSPAERVMRSALDLLTGGAFSVQYAAHPNSQGGKAPLMINNNMLVNLGFWSDPSYGDRDIRDLDYLGYLAMTAAVDQEAQANWHGLHVNTNIDPWLRLEKMTDIQRSIFQNMEIHGRASRVTISPVALFVFTSIVGQQGFAYELKDNNSETNGIQRMVAPWLPQISMGLGQSNAFVTNHQNRQGGGNYIGGITNSGRYGNIPNGNGNGGVSY